jgi:hypothetical protein
MTQLRLLIQLGGDWLAACGTTRLVGCRVHVWFGAWGSGSGPDDAKGSCEPGSGGAEKLVACREPGSLGACEHVGPSTQ